MMEELWWIIPPGMMILCCFMMGGKKGSALCGFGSHKPDHSSGSSDSAGELLGKRYALGEIDRAEYEEKKSVLNQSG